MRHAEPRRVCISVGKGLGFVHTNIPHQHHVIDNRCVLVQATTRLPSNAASCGGSSATNALNQRTGVIKKGAR
jgi:hypothetical protein